MVNHRTFIRIYNNSKNTEEVAEALGMKHISVKMRAYALRCRGFILKRLTDCRKGKSWEEIYKRGNRLPHSRGKIPGDTCPKKKGNEQ